MTCLNFVFVSEGPSEPKATHVQNTEFHSESNCSGAEFTGFSLLGDHALYPLCLTHHSTYIPLHFPGTQAMWRTICGGQYSRDLCWLLCQLQPQARHSWALLGEHCFLPATSELSTCAGTQNIFETSTLAETGQTGGEVGMTSQAISFPNFILRKSSRKRAVGSKKHWTERNFHKLGVVMRGVWIMRFLGVNW